MTTRQARGARVRWRLVRLAAMTLVLGGCGEHGARPNVLLVVVDALRADHLPCYGYARETAPAMCRLAAEGARFAHSYAQATSTVPTHASLFTGRLPFQHGAYDVLRPLREEEETLAEFLASRGYRTFAVASSIRFNARSGFAQGFETYQNHGRWTPKAHLGPAVTTNVLELLRADDPRPVFGFVHYLGPHQPYMPPQPFRTRWHPGLPGLRPRDTGDFILQHRRPGQPVDAATLDYLVALYDGEISWVDTQIARLLEALEELGMADDTIVVLTSDHGEEFKEHGGLAHGGRRLHEELLRVPLLVRWPGRVSPGRVIERPVQTVDVFPTLAALAGLVPPDGLAGRDRSGELLATGVVPPDDRDVVVVEQAPKTWAVLATVAGRRLKYEVRAGAAPVLFDLTSDPAGTRDVLASMPDAAAELGRIADRIGVGRRPAVAERVEDVPADVRARLRALGYVEEAERARGR